jgi:alkane 1-monooxygenase
MFLGQSFVAFSLLEIVNYIEHYGLTRRQLGDPSLLSPKSGPLDQATAIREKIHFEAVTPRHSWNADQRITNLFLFKLQRHSDHHAYASRRYQILRSFSEAPQVFFFVHPHTYLSIRSFIHLPVRFFFMCVT